MRYYSITIDPELVTEPRMVKSSLTDKVEPEFIVKSAPELTFIFLTEVLLEITIVEPDGAIA